MSTERGALTLQTGRWPEFTPGYSPSLQLDQRGTLGLAGYECVYDLAVVGDRVVALVEGQSKESIVATTTLDLAGVTCDDAPPDARRIAVTKTNVFVMAGDTLVTEKRSVFEKPIDLASTADCLAVLHDGGVTFLDEQGIPHGKLPLFEATAIAVDRIEGGWLLAVDGGIAHVRGPDDSPKLIASVADPVRKVRRSRDAIYVLVGREVRAIRGERVEVLGYVDDNAWYWTDFDAGPKGFVTYGELASSPER